jgi:hypothetical protein
MPLIFPKVKKYIITYRISETSKAMQIEHQAESTKKLRTHFKKLFPEHKLISIKLIK